MAVCLNLNAGFIFISFKNLSTIADKKYYLIFDWHCCGSIHEVLPEMISAGIDIFDVVQSSAREMDLENIYKLYGHKVCLRVGMDVQDLLVQKKPKDVKEEVLKVIDLWGKRGGIILGPSHECMPRTPAENIATIYEAINGYFKR